MENTALVGLSRQVALKRELDVVANNIANINTTGYKADGALFEEFLSSSSGGAGRGGKVSFVRDRGVWHDMNQGAIEQTGNSLDVAIEGSGFLVVQTPRGDRYTRNGSLQLNEKGQLVTNDGSLVMGTNGPIAFRRTDTQISISRDGTISAREGSSHFDSVRGRLRVVNFENLQALKKDGASTYNAPEDLTPQTVKSPGIVQGALEKSNVRGVVEMSRMIEITRSYTQVANILQQKGDLDHQAISKLAEVPN